MIYMKQRVIVQGLIKNFNEILLLRRFQGNPDVIGKYELPGGRIDDHEQPEDALRRHLQKDLGITINKLKLSDVLSVTSRDDVNAQYIFVVYVGEVTSKETKIKSGRSYDSCRWLTRDEMHQIPLRDTTAKLLSLEDGFSPDGGNIQSENDGIVGDAGYTNKEATTIYSDGGSRGNPGPSAAAFVIIGDDHSVIEDGGEYLGITTNNQAEYQGVLLGLQRALELGIKIIEFRIDSMLVVNQLKGIYNIKNRDLWPINERIEELIKKFESVEFNHVPRELNKLADSLVNKILDEHKY